ncbi:MAG: hypothetical protein KGP08_08445 [Xanthomonadaceae bacterium]|nr:hypothetical protein [Xanthomonadaceae bacterium]
MAMLHTASALSAKWRCSSMGRNRNRKIAQNFEVDVLLCRLRRVSFQPALKEAKPMLDVFDGDAR